MYVNNLIEPKFRSQTFIVNEKYQIEFSNDLFGFAFQYNFTMIIDKFQALSNLTYVMYYPQYYNSDAVNNITQLIDFNVIKCTDPSLQGLNCIDFAKISNQTLQLDFSNKVFSSLQINVYGCFDLDTVKTTIPSNYASQTEIDNVFNGLDSQFQIKMKTQQYNIEYNQLIQSFDRQQSLQAGLGPYLQENILMDELLQQFQTQYPTITEILALANTFETKFRCQLEKQQVQMNNSGSQNCINNQTMVTQEDEIKEQQTKDRRNLNTKTLITQKFRSNRLIDICDDTNINKKEFIQCKDTSSINIVSSKRLFNFQNKNYLSQKRCCIQNPANVLNCHSLSILIQNEQKEKTSSNKEALKGIISSMLKALHSNKMKHAIHNLIFKYKIFNFKAYLFYKGIDHKQIMNIEKEFKRSQNIYQFYEDIIFLKKAILMLLSQEQLTAIKLVSLTDNYFNLDLKIENLNSEYKIKFISRNIEDSFRTDQIIPQENVQEVEKNLIKTQKELLSIINELFCSSKVNNQSYQQINEEELNEMERNLYQKKKKMEEIVDNILKKTEGDKSINSIECMKIVEQLNLLQPFFQNFDDSIKDINEEKFIQFYKRFQTIFKNFESNSKNVGLILEDTFKYNKKIPKEKIQQIQQCILSTKNDLLSIQKAIFTVSQKYLIWIDYNLNSLENQKCLSEINLICKRVMNVVTFDNDSDFRQFVQNQQEHILYLIMSGKAAGERPGDGQNLKWIKQIIEEKKGYQFVYGIFILVSNNNEQQYFTPHLESNKGLILNITYQQQIILNDIKDLVFPKKSLRVIEFKQLSQYLSEKKEEFLSLATNDYSNYNLDDFHPDKPFQISSNYKSISKEIRDRFEKKNLQERLIEAKKVIQEYKIGISEFNPQQIYDDFKQCFFYIKNQNYIQDHSQKIIFKNQEIAIKILKLYTKESCFYKFINNLLGIMNQYLLIVLWDIILCLRISLSIFNDEADSQIFKPFKQEGQDEKVRTKLNLFRGAAIPQDVFNSIYKVGKVICMCGFSSFSSEINVAYGFSKIGQGIKVIFQLLYECGTEQFNLRPRYLDKISECPGEKEYLLNCGSVFKITKIQEKEINQVKYTFVELKI
ncbi:hypothetical protein ABPG72_000748 [Tetrahymena utriculariae]